MPDFNVIIIGAGLGGLTLAQSLRRAGISFRLFERDASPWDRPQGYRLHLDVDGIAAMHEVLAPDLRAVFEATSQSTLPFTQLLHTDLQVFKQLPAGNGQDLSVWPPIEWENRHCNVDRATLRQILLAGMAPSIDYGRAFSHYQQDQDGVMVHFDDGFQLRGDVLVGADGIHSAVRARRAPQIRLMDSGIRAIYGRIPLSAGKEALPASLLSASFSIASDDRKVFLGLGPVVFPQAPPLAGRQAGLKLRARQDYLACVIGGREAYFGGDGMDADWMTDPATAAGRLLQAWPDAARRLLQQADPAAFFPLRMDTSVPAPMGAPHRVSLLGDAIHAMTPALGRGANLAMRDGVLLGRAIRRARDGLQTVPSALADYEQHMLDYGQAAVRLAARVGAQRMGQRPLPADAA